MEPWTLFSPGVDLEHWAAGRALPPARLSGSSGDDRVPKKDRRGRVDLAGSGKVPGKSTPWPNAHIQGEGGGDEWLLGERATGLRRRTGGRTV